MQAHHAKPQEGQGGSGRTQKDTANGSGLWHDDTQKYSLTFNPYGSLERLGGGSIGENTPERKLQPYSPLSLNKRLTSRQQLIAAAIPNNAPIKIG